MISDLAGVPVDALFAVALAGIRDEDDDAFLAHLVELHRRGTEEIFDVAMRLSSSLDVDERALGIEVLRELGPYGPDGRRPFSDRAVPHLLAQLRAERDERVEQALLQALAFNGAREARAEFTARVEHPNVELRRTVAFQLPSVVDPVEIDTTVSEALETLCGDADADVRYYALHALVEEGLPIDPDRRTRILTRLRDDPDAQVRDLAREHAQQPAPKQVVESGTTRVDAEAPERVHIELDWYDGPRSGIADVVGVPHYFQAVNDYNHGDPTDEEYLVWAVPPGVLDHEQEQWRIFVHWNQSYERGEATIASHPGHGGIDERYDALDASLRPHRSAPPQARVLRADWYPVGSPQRYTEQGPSYRVRWHQQHP